jgi:hypothetical protein
VRTPQTFYREKESCFDNYCNFDAPFDPNKCVTKAGITGDCRPKDDCDKNGLMRVEGGACEARFGHGDDDMCCYNPRSSVRKCRTSANIKGDCVDAEYCTRSSGRVVEGDKCLGVGANGRPIQDHMSCCYNPTHSASAPTKPENPEDVPWWRRAKDWIDTWQPFSGGTNM